MVELKEGEEKEQILLVQWFRRTYPNVLIFHIPNGGKRGKTEAARFKATGVVAGVPDLYIPEWKIWIEMKAKGGGRVSEYQEFIHEYLTAIGDRVIVGKGYEEAKDKLQRLLAL